MTDLQREYFKLRGRGFKHATAVNALARHYGLDPDTVRRTLQRAGTTAHSAIPDLAADELRDAA